MTPAKENDALIITPTELKFRFQVGKNIPTTISLHNPTSDRFAFKVKTTSPKKYCVRPSAGFIGPNSTKDVEIIMQSQKEYPADLGNCRDKFLLQSVVAAENETEVTSALFDKSNNKDVRETKLRVQLEGPAAPPSPIPENSPEEEPLLPKDKGGLDTFKSAALPVQSKTSKDPVDELEKIKNERDELKKKVDLMEFQMGRPAPKVVTTKDGQQQMMVQKGFTLLQLILVALIAFLLGHYTS